MTGTFFPIERLRLFSADGQVYRAYDHLIAARRGALLLVPQLMVVGRLIDVVGGCPVPWEEVHAVLQYPNNSPIRELRSLMPEVGYINRLGYLGFDLSEFDMDRIAPMVNGEEKVLRLVHPSGVRYAVVMP